MSEPRAGGRNLGQSPIKGENYEAGKPAEFNLDASAAPLLIHAFLSFFKRRVCSNGKGMKQVSRERNETGQRTGNSRYRCILKC